MPAHITTDSLVATTKSAPVSGASVWRWLVLLQRKWALSRKIARDARYLRTAPQALLADIGIERSEVDITCTTGSRPEFKQEFK